MLVFIPMVTMIFFKIVFGFDAGSHIAQAGPEFLILLPLPPEHWDYRCDPPHPAVALLLIDLP